MQSYLILCIFGVALLAQGIPAYPAKGLTENDKEQMLSEFIEDLTSSVAWLVEETKTVSINIIEETKNKPDLGKYVEDFVEFNKREKELSNKSDDDRFLLLGQAVDLLKKYIAKDDDNVEASLKEIQSLLKAQGYVTIKEKLFERFVALGELIDKRIKSYIDSLTSSQKAEESEMIEWYEKVQKETNLKRQLGLYMDVFDILDTEE